MLNGRFAPSVMAALRPALWALRALLYGRFAPCFMGASRHVLWALRAMFYGPFAPRGRQANLDRLLRLSCGPPRERGKSAVKSYEFTVKKHHFGTCGIS